MLPYRGKSSEGHICSWCPHTVEIERARVIQSRLNAFVPVVDEKQELYGGYAAAQLLGGDFVTVVDQRPERTLLFLGDVMGKGTPAALVAVLIRTAALGEAAGTAGPAEILARVNRRTFADLQQIRAFSTLACGVYEPATRRLTYALAGHPPPYRAGAGGVARLGGKGPVLGVFPAPRYEEESLALAPGDLVLFVSDGLLDAQNAAGERYGKARLEAFLALAARSEAVALGEMLFQDLARFSGQERQADDVGFVYLKARK